MTIKRRKLEASLEDRCVRYVKQRGWLARKMNGLGFRAWPDRLFIPLSKRLLSFWVEFKREGEKPTPLQEKIHQMLRARGERVEVIDNYDDFIKLTGR